VEQHETREKAGACHANVARTAEAARGTVIKNGNHEDSKNTKFSFRKCRRCLAALAFRKEFFVFFVLRFVFCLY